MLKNPLSQAAVDQSVEQDAEFNKVYEGQFGTFTITPRDRQDVILYRAALAVATLCFVSGVSLALSWGDRPIVLTSLTYLYWGFSVALGISLLLIHIYLVQLHRALQAFWLIGMIATIGISFAYPEPLLLTVYQHPLSVLGVGFTFAALTGIFFKEAFCFDRLETKLLTPLVPLVLLGHLFGLIPLQVEQLLLASWAILMVVFVVRKSVQPIPPDIGDKSVFEYLSRH